MKIIIWKESRKLLYSLNPGEINLACDESFPREAVKVTFNSKSQFGVSLYYVNKLNKQFHGDFYMTCSKVIT